MKTLTCSICLLFVVFLSSAQGFLKASDKKIVNEKGDNVLLRGIGLGGWMLQEGYMLRLQGTNPQYSIRNRIQKLLTAEQTQQFYDAWLQNFITKADIDSMRAWGFNSVRLPMHYNLFTLPIEKEPDPAKQTWIQKGFQLTDSLLSWCKANNIYLILDLHAAPGGQGNDFNIADRDSTKPSLWQSEANKAKTIALWKKLAERYKDEPWIGAYDLLNETNWGFEDPNDRHGQKETNNKPLRDLMMRITEAIRSVDKKHIVIIEGNSWGNNYKGVFPLWDNNIVISFHKYWNNNDLKSIQHMLDAREQQNAPIWLGETGENSNPWFADAVRLFEENNIGWSWWPLKKIGINNPLEVKANTNYTNLVNYWNGRGASSTDAGNAYSGLMELAANTNIRSNPVHRDVIDALIRQPFSASSRPFRQIVISSKDSVINAVDYDLGRNGVAYYDKDTGNYSGSGGRRTVGNRGYSYRNDGVDIFRDSINNELFYVGSLEDGEWMQYTVEVKETGMYAAKLSTAGSEGNITLIIDRKPAIENASLAGTKNAKIWEVQKLGTLFLDKGIHAFRILVNRGGFNIKQLLLSMELENSVVAPGEQLQLVSNQFSFTEGPATDKAGNIYFTDQPNNHIWKYDMEGKLTLFMDNAGRSNGMYFDKSGNLISCADEHNQLWSIAPDKKVNVLVKDYEGKLLNGPNDVWVDRATGGIYFTDPYYQRDYWERKSSELPGMYVYYLAPGSDKPVMVCDSLKRPNGITGSPDGKYLYVADIGDNKTYRFERTSAGLLVNRQLFVNQGSDGITVDSKGNLYLTGKGVTVYDKTGNKIAFINVPEPWTANLCIGGKNRDILFITASKSVYTLKLKVKGVE